MTATELNPPVESLPNEEWLPVVDHEGTYSISSMGRLFSHIHNRLLTPVHGRRVVLAGGRAVSIGELILETWGQPKPGKGWIAFPVRCDIDRPYRLTNLRWISRDEFLAILREARATAGDESADEPEAANA